MAEETEETPPSSGEPPPATGNEQNEDDALLEGAKNPDAVKNAIDRQKAAARAEKKRADGLATKLQEIEDRDKTEQQKKDEAAAAAEKRATDAEAKLLRYEVAADKKLPIDLAEFLTGSSKEEMEAAADKLLERIDDAKPEADFRSGAREPVKDDGDMDALIRKQAGVA